MGFFETLKQNFTELVRKEVRPFSAGEITPNEKLPAIPWLYHSEYGVPIRADVLTLRALAKSSWVQMVESAITKQVLQTEYVITVVDETEDVTQYAEDIKRITTFLNYPNRNKQTFYDVWGMFLRDVLEIDRGVIVKGFNNAGQLVELFAVDGARFQTKIDQYGIIEGYYQYSFYSPSGEPVFFKPEEIISGVMNTSTERFPYGFSPLQSVQQEVELLINSTRYNKDFYKNNAIPDAIGVFDTDEEGMRRINLEWDQNVRGKAHKMLMTNAKNFDLKVLRMNNRDMEWLEGQKWYHHAIFGAYGLSPQEVGFYESSNRATSDGQERTTIRNAVRPYMKLIADKINRDIIPDLVGHDKVQFVWQPLNVAEEQIEHQQNMDLVDRGIMTVDEYRAMVGMEALEMSENAEAQAESREEPQALDEDMPELAGQDEQAPDDVEVVSKAPKVTEAVRNGLKRKVEEHNEKHGDTESKRVTLRMLIAVFRRGVGAYRTNPRSVRPSVKSEEQWAYARVNSFLYAVRNSKFRSGRHDTDLFPEGHKLSSKGKEKEEQKKMLTEAVEKWKDSLDRKHRVDNFLKKWKEKLKE